MSKDSKRTVRRAARLARPAAESLEGRLLLATQTFGTPLSANIHEEIFQPPPTPAFRYPLATTVEGVTGTITELRVTLNYFYHDRPEDVDVLLVSPDFNSIIIMSDAGSDFPVSDGADLTFTDLATRDLPENGQITPGLYRPTNYDFDDYFPDEPPDNAPTHDTLMGLVNSGNVNGMWRLYIVDDTFGAEGGVGFGFSLTFVTGAPGPAAPGTPDLPAQFDRGLSSSDNVTNNSAPFFRGTAAEGTQVRILVDGVGQATGPITNGTYNIQTVVPEGTHTISARALNAEGTEGPPSGEITVTIDTIIPPIPTVPDLDPASDTGASNIDNDTTDTTPTFTGTAPEAARIVLFAGESLVGTADVGAGGAYTITATTPLAPGTYAFSTMSTDLAGNSSAVSNPALNVVIRGGVTPGPVITDAYARGSAWSAPFKQHLEGQGIGDDAWGYRLAPGDVLPWINVNQLVLRYADALPSAPTAGEILVDSVRSEDYTVTISLLDPRTVLLTLGRTLGALPAGGENGDRVRLTVPGAAAGGAAYSIDFNVLQGDANRSGSVLANDFSDVKKKFFRSTTAPGPAGDTQYTPFHDVNGSGSILADDFSEVKKRFFDSLPPAPAAPAGSPFGETRVADDVLV